MTSHKYLLFLALVWIATTPHAGDMEPWAPPAPTMKALSGIEPRSVIWAEMLPLVITQSASSWYLGEGIEFEGADNGITVAADGVTIDLNGFVLRGPGFGSADGIHVNSGHQNVTVRNGTVTWWGDDGIDAEGAEQTKFTGLMLVSNQGHGLFAGRYSLVGECIAAYNEIGIVADDESVVHDCVAHGNSTGYSLSWSSIRDSVARWNFGVGINVGFGSSVVHCQAIGNGVDGIRALAANTVSDCVAKDNLEDGIEVGSGNYVLRNTADKNVNGAGILAGGQSNRIDSNNVLANDRGIEVVGFPNLIVRNSAAANGTDYDIVPGNDVGPYGAAATSTSPWTNIQF